MKREAEQKFEDYLTVSEAARLLGISPSTLRNWDRNGKLTARRHPINNYRLYRRQELVGLLKEASPRYVSSRRKEIQVQLFDSTHDVDSETITDDTSIFRDPAFSSNKRVPVHRWVPWIAGFSADFVQSAIERYLPKKGTILDPFAGVGTTLVEAVLGGHDAVGFEINPYAVLACRVKVKAYEIDPQRLKGEIQAFGEFCKNAMKQGREPESKPPPGFRTKTEFYSPRVLRKVLTVQDFIKRLKSGRIKDLFRLAFASTMVSYSNYSYEPSLGRRASAGKEEIHDFPVRETIARKLNDMRYDILWMREQIRGRRCKISVFAESFLEGHRNLGPSSVDLLVTSPPYLNNYHYNRNTRPHLYWLGFVDKPGDMRHLEEDNFGKYWQTVRAKDRIVLDFQPVPTEIKECLDVLRAKTPEKGVYGGNGWANYAASYFNDCHRFARAAAEVLKPGATALVVIGNSILQGVMVPTDGFLALIADLVGLEVVGIHMPRNTRVGNSIIQSDVRVAKAKDSHALYEAVVELRKK